MVSKGSKKPDPRPVANNSVDEWYVFPELQVSVQAKSIAEAEGKARKKVKEQK